MYSSNSGISFIDYSAMKLPFGVLPLSMAPKDGSYVMLVGNSGYTDTPFRAIVAHFVKEYATPGMTQLSEEEAEKYGWRNHSNDSVMDDGSMPFGFIKLPWEWDQSQAELTRQLCHNLALALAFDIRKAVEIGDNTRAIVESFVHALDLSMANNIKDEAVRELKQHITDLEAALRRPPSVDSVLSMMQGLKPEARVNIIETFCRVCGTTLGNCDHYNE